MKSEAAKRKRLAVTLLLALALIALFCMALVPEWSVSWLRWNF